MLGKSSYDYIVIGSGSAGAIVAARLSEDKSVSVLLIEAGGSDKNIFIKMPTALGIPMNTRRSERRSQVPQNRPNATVRDKKKLKRPSSSNRRPPK